MTTKTFEFEVKGIPIISDTMYQVIPKYDANAPQGFKDHGTTKLLQNGITESAPCVYDENLRLWDTGFYEKSPCYRGMKSTEIQTLVEQLQEHIVEPYEEIIGKGGLRATSDNNDFWDLFGTRPMNSDYALGQIYNGKVFNTANPKDLLELYIAILHGSVVLEKDTSAPHARAAKFCIVNKEAAVNLKEKRLLQKAEAIGSFTALLKSNPKKLKSVLEYLGIIASNNVEDTTLVSLLMVYLEDPKIGHENVKRFNETINKASKENGAKEIELFSTLSLLFRKGVIKKEYGEFYLNGTLLGNKIKDGAYKAVSDKNLETEIFEALEALENKTKQVVVEKPKGKGRPATKK